MADPVYKFSENPEAGPMAIAPLPPGYLSRNAGADPNSTAIAAAQAADAAARTARMNDAAPGGVLIAEDSRANEWNDSFKPGGENYQLTPQQFNEENPVMPAGRDRRRRPFEDLRTQARDYHGSTSDVVANTLAAHKDISSADFVRKLSGLDSTHPEYPQQFADLVAMHPTAGGKLVDQVIEHQQNRREVFNKAVENGGASAYGSKDNPTPEYMAYVTTLQQSKDPVQAKAAAERVSKQVNEILDLKGQGLLTDDDLPAWDEKWKNSQQTRPAGWNKDGTINIAALKNLAATRKGSGAGLRGQEALIKEQDSSIKEFGAQLANMDPTDPNYAKVHSLWQAALNARTARMNGQPAAANPAAPGPTAPAAKPKTVTQGGHTYTLQADGSYK